MDLCGLPTHPMITLEAVSTPERVFLQESKVVKPISTTELLPQAYSQQQIPATK
jgi:hypothetical protein